MSHLTDLLALLALENLGADRYRGWSHAHTLTRTFGGQVAAQALIAAGHTVAPQYAVHSLHSYFLRGGDSAHPIDYQVERVRDGRGFVVRRVVAWQFGKPTFTLSASFHRPEPETIEHLAVAPRVPRPETLPTLREVLAPYPDRVPAFLRARGDLPVEIRPVRWIEQDLARRAGDPVPRLADDLAEQAAADPDDAAAMESARATRLWFRAGGPMPADPLVHVCVAVYVSDMTALDAVSRRNVDPASPWGATGADATADGTDRATLDHAMWFHRPLRVDDWVLYETTSPAAAGARGFAQGRMFDAEGRLAISVAQEGLFRRRTR